MLYKDGRQLVEVLPKFLYELSIFASIKNQRIELISNRQVITNKPIKIKKDVKVKKYKDYKIVTYLELLGAPLSYLELKGFKIAE